MMEEWGDGYQCTISDYLGNDRDFESEDVESSNQRISRQSRAASQLSLELFSQRKMGSR